MTFWVSQYRKKLLEKILLQHFWECNYLIEYVIKAIALPDIFYS